MDYVKTEWVTGDVITAPKLNNIEQGIYNAYPEINGNANIKYFHIYYDEGTWHIGNDYSNSLSSINELIDYVANNRALVIVAHPDDKLILYAISILYDSVNNTVTAWFYTTWNETMAMSLEISENGITQNTFDTNIVFFVEGSA